MTAPNAFEQFAAAQAQQAPQAAPPAQPQPQPAQSAPVQAAPVQQAVPAGSPFPQQAAPAATAPVQTAPVQQAAPVGSPFPQQAAPAATAPVQTAPVQQAAPVGQFPGVTSLDDLSIAGVDITEELAAANKRGKLSDFTGRQVLIRTTSIMPEWQAPKGRQTNVPVVDMWVVSDPIPGFGDQSPAGTRVATNTYVTNVAPKLVLGKQFAAGKSWVLVTVGTEKTANGNQSVTISAVGVTQEHAELAGRIITAEAQAAAAAAAGGN